MVNTSSTDLPNPSTPLAFLPPALASQFEASRYLYAATLGAYVWDIGLNLGNDYTLLFKHRLNIWITAVVSVKHCNAIAIGFSICFVLSQTSTAMLFFLRVTAVWYPSKIAYVVFCTLWIAVLGAGITVPLGVRAAHIEPTMQCVTTAVPGNVEVASIIPLINDTAIFLAINHRILAHTIVADSSMARLRVFFGGAGLSKLSEALLRSGQHFYLCMCAIAMSDDSSTESMISRIAVAANLALLVMLKLPQSTPVINGMLPAPALALTNTMACLVFRRIKFGLISSDGTSNIPTLDLHATANPRSHSLHSRRTGPTTSEFGRDIIFPLEVHMQTVVDEFKTGAEFTPVDLA
ncbi:hypothetical protein MSAN_01321000 [Mycena sanguinolenta]|uniref:Uncharacterized protein n=1 Tax=Mycena sanguinolenta TaxID=230812 RepID=A0A8H6YA73_9AGAR|nr:hypothetical protein MSAN_01321000 [Mycena sanguinolenta]